ncbi:hypothetical protein KIPB_010278, partial [Kipferlia bialata]
IPSDSGSDWTLSIQGVQVLEAYTPSPTTHAGDFPPTLIVSEGAGTLSDSTVDGVPWGVSPLYLRYYDEGTSNDVPGTMQVRCKTYKGDDTKDESTLTTGSKPSECTICIDTNHVPSDTASCQTSHSNGYVTLNSKMVDGHIVSVFPASSAPISVETSLYALETIDTIVEAVDDAPYALVIEPGSYHHSNIAVCSERVSACGVSGMEYCTPTPLSDTYTDSGCVDIGVYNSMVVESEGGWVSVVQRGVATGYDTAAETAVYTPSEVDTLQPGQMYFEGLSHDYPALIALQQETGDPYRIDTAYGCNGNMLCNSTVAVSHLSVGSSTSSMSGVHALVGMAAHSVSVGVTVSVPSEEGGEGESVEYATVQGAAYQGNSLSLTGVTEGLVGPMETESGALQFASAAPTGSTLSVSMCDGSASASVCFTASLPSVTAGHCVSVTGTDQWVSVPSGSSNGAYIATGTGLMSVVMVDPRTRVPLVPDVDSAEVKVETGYGTVYASIDTNDCDPDIEYALYYYPDTGAVDEDTPPCTYIYTGTQISEWVGPDKAGRYAPVCIHSVYI